MVLEVTAALLAFIAVSGLLISLLGQAPLAQALEQRLDSWRRPPPSQGLQAGDVLRQGASTFPLLRLLLSKVAWNERAAMDLQQAGLRLKIGEYLLLRLLTAVVLPLLVLFVTRGQLGGVLLAIPLAVLGFMLPALYVSLKKTQRAAAIDRQLVEVLQLLSNALRSGFAFSQAVEMAANQVARPMQDELNHFLRDSALGARTDDALRAMVERAGSYDLDMAVTAILVQRTTGGNLSEVLEKVSETMRERDRIRGDIRSLTAHQRLTGLFLSIYPLVLGLIFFALAPSLMSVLVTEPLGRILLVVAGGLQLLGAFIIRRILSIDI